MPGDCKVMYTMDELKERIKYLASAKVSLSNQYGMLFLLDAEGRIILRLDNLVDEKERMK